MSSRNSDTAEHDSEEDLADRVQTVENRLMILENKVQELHNFVKPYQAEEQRPYHKSEADSVTPPNRTLVIAIVRECQRGASDTASIEVVKEEVSKLGYAKFVTRSKVEKWVGRGLLDQPHEGEIRFVDTTLSTFNEELEKPVDLSAVNPAVDIKHDLV